MLLLHRDGHSNHPGCSGFTSSACDNTANPLAWHIPQTWRLIVMAFLCIQTPAMPQGGDTADDVMNVTDPVSGITYQVITPASIAQVRYEVGLSWGVAAISRHSALLLG